MSIFDDIRRDREAGTPGPFFTQDEFLNLFALSGGNSGQTIHLAKINSLQLEHTGDPKGEAFANLRRFARVPDLERIALAAEELAKECDRIAPVVGEAIEAHGLGDKHGIATANAFRAALAAFRDATR